MNKLLCISFLVLIGCTSTTEYEPLIPGRPVSTGFSDKPLSSGFSDKVTNHDGTRRLRGHAQDGTDPK